MDIREVAVVGLGTMGAGIAEVFARSGLAVTAIEADPEALSRGMALLDGSLSRAVSRGKLTAEEQAEIFGRIRPATSLADTASADLVLEAVPEDLSAKREIIGLLDKICREDTIFATNTSSLSVTTLAGASAHPNRVVGMHFFNPAPVMRLVEVVTTVVTHPAVGETVASLARQLGKEPVQVTDRAGFVANALLLPYLNQAVRLFETGYASREDIDTAATVGVGLPMGPLALLDLIGLDTSLAVLEVLRREFGGTRYTPAPLLRRLVDAGRLGRKRGAGFYGYGGTQPGATAAASTIEMNANQPPIPGTITLVDPGASEAPDAGPGGSDRAAVLASLIAQAGASVTRNPAHPTDLVIVAVGPEGGVQAGARAAGLPGSRAADAVGMHLASADLAEVVAARHTSPAAVSAAHALAVRFGRTPVQSGDRPGLLAGTLLYPHLRDAVAMIDDGYATPADVDAAMIYGCGYRRGPIAMLAEIGPDRVVAVLRAMHASYGDPAFAPSPLLTDYAAAGLP